MVNTQDKVKTTNIGLTLRSANPAEYPVLYTDDSWEVVKEGMTLKNIMGAAAAWTQTEINEKIGEAIAENQTRINILENKETNIDEITIAQINALDWVRPNDK